MLLVAAKSLNTIIIHLFWTFQHWIFILNVVLLHECLVREYNGNEQSEALLSEAGDVSYKCT